MYRNRFAVVRGWSRLLSVDWNGDSETIFVPSVSSNGSSVLLEIDQQGNAQVLLTAEKDRRIGWAFPSPDGQHLALMQVVGENNAWMLENF